MDYDKKYAGNANLFGRSPEKILVRFRKRLNPQCSVLDIGAGQGRNTLYLARRGFRVIAIDPSKVAIQTISAIAGKKDLPVLVHQSSFADFEPNTKKFGTILVIGLIQILKREEIELLVKKINAWTHPGCFVMLTGFTTMDPGFKEMEKNGKKIGKNSFLNLENRVRTFLEKDEITSLFTGFDVAYHWEGMGQKHRHGAGPEEQHGMVEAIFLKPEKENQN